MREKESSSDGHKEGNRRQDPSLDRRNFLKGLGALGIASLVPSVAEAKKATLVHAEPEEAKEKQEGKPEKEAALEATILAIQEKLRTPELQAALRGEGTAPLETILEALSSEPILAGDLEGTKYDVGELQNRFPVNFNHGNWASNAVLWKDTDTVATAAHAIWGDHPSRFPLPGIEAETWKKESIFPPEKIPVEDDASVTDESVDGCFITIVGHDRDDDVDKVYPGIALKICPKLASTMISKNNVERLQQAEHSFLVLLPAGESKKTLPSGRMRAVGMSGSPMFAWMGGKYRFSGLLSLVQNITDYGRGLTFDVGLVTGIDGLRAVEAYKKSVGAS